MRKLLITGGAGFIGANFVHYWLVAASASDRVVVLDALTYAGNRANLARHRRQCRRFRFVHGDICDADARRGAHAASERIDCVVHFAAESHVDRSITGPDEFIRTNVLGTHALLKSGTRGLVARKVRCAPTCVSTMSRPTKCTGRSRLDDPAIHRDARLTRRTHPIRRARLPRTTWCAPITTPTGCRSRPATARTTTGPYQFPEKLIPLDARARAAKASQLPVYGPGENVRDWLYVEDHCRAIDAVLQRGRVGETYNVGGCNEWRNIDIVKKLCQLIEQRFAADSSLARRFPRCPAARGLPVDSLIAYVTDRPGHDWRYAIDAGRS